MVTPHESYPRLAQALALPEKASFLYFKREDLHPYGSHKGRSIPHMIDAKVKEGCRHFVISSSGNAALAAGLYIKELNDKRKDDGKIMLEILAGKNINSDKLKKLESLKDENILLSLQDRPLQVLFTKTQEPGVESLRQSESDIALEGYGSLAKELLEIPDLKVVFMGTSSGTTAQALAEYFTKNKKKIEVYIIQTSSCHPIADSFVENYSSDEKSLADAIVDKTAIRKDAVIAGVEKTGGGGWIASNEQIRTAQELTKTHAGITISPNSALSVAGLMEAIYTGKKWDGAIVCMICGD
jgi:threonine dehydratase